MLKVVVVVDKKDTAIDRLAQAQAQYMRNYDYVICDVHPKRPDDDQMARFLVEAAGADIIDFQYFRSAEMLLDNISWLKDKKLILAHHNPYSIFESKWDRYDMVVANNKTIFGDLRELMHNPEKRLTLIPNAVDPSFWRFNFDWKPNKRVLMVANRIEGKKGILEVAIACGELGLTFVLVGAVSDRQYMHSVFQTGNVEFHEQCTDQELLDLYYTSTIHVCNSVDKFESGTMPILQAMQTGVPVLTRMIGLVPDLYDGENMVINEAGNEDVQSIQDHLEAMMADSKALETLRQKAWNTGKNYNSERRAYSYQRLYRAVQEGEPVSVIVPIYDKPETIRACLNAIANQDYPNIELIVVDDNPTPNKEMIDEFSSTVNFPVRYIYSAIPDSYGLARARNLGAIEATGDILVFCDQRQIMAPDAVRVFVENLTPKSWVYGDKGGNKPNFVENFSAIARHEFVEAGMFNERITAYGGMSQEIRQRTRVQGFRHVYLPEAKATPMGKSSNRNRKKDEIIAMKNLLFKVGL